MQVIDGKRRESLHVAALRRAAPRTAASSVIGIKSYVLDQPRPCRYVWKGLRYSSNDSWVMLTHES